jgi:hypothetical protein
LRDAGPEAAHQDVLRSRHRYGGDGEGDGAASSGTEHFIAAADYGSGAGRQDRSKRRVRAIPNVVRELGMCGQNPCVRLA